MKNEDDDEDDDDTSSSDSEAREGLRLLLGGISFDTDALKQAFQCSGSSANDKQKHYVPDRRSPTNMKNTIRGYHHHNQSNNNHSNGDSDVDFDDADADIANLVERDNAHEDDDDFDGIFSLAFKTSGYCTPNGRVELPPVKVVNMDKCTSRRRRRRRGKQQQQQQQERQKLGNGMIATRFIPKGDVIYTERAAVACQIPDFSSSASSSCCTAASNVHGGQAGMATSIKYSVRACQWCFRSLEPASSCCTTNTKSSSLSSNKGNDTITGTAAAASVIELPLAQRLWPIPEIEWIDESNNHNSNEHHSLPRRDRHGRVLCPQCLAWFCSDTCCQSFEKALGSHCLVTRSTQSLQYHVDSGSDDDDDVSSSEPVQAAVALAVRMFCQSLQHYRTTGGNLFGTYLDGLCGEATEISPLELGIRVQEKTSTTSSSCSPLQQSSYTLYPVYQQLLNVWDMTATEQAALSLAYFHELAVKAARNGIGLQTQCPFQTYYAGLMRQSGRGTAQSLEYRNLVAMVLSASFGNSQGQDDATSLPSSSSSFTTFNTDATTTPLPALQSLDRDMDRRVSERVAPEIVALFPLTARINHSCQPNAQVQGQVFCDCHLDLTATQDIHAGQEITISYIHGSSSSSTANTSTSSATTVRPRGRRRRELQAKYLFECHCSLCSGKG
jgi:SET domain